MWGCRFFNQILEEEGVEKLIIQYGKGDKPNTEFFSHSKIDMEYYDYKNSIKEDLESCDVVISHAGNLGVIQVPVASLKVW